MQSLFFPTFSPGVPRRLSSPRCPRSSRDRAWPQSLTPGAAGSPCLIRAWGPVPVLLTMATASSRNTLLLNNFGLQAESANVLWIRAPALFSCYRMSQPSLTASGQAGGWVAGPHRGRVVSHRRSHPPGDHSSKPVLGWEVGAGLRPAVCVPRAPRSEPGGPQGDPASSS